MLERLVELSAADRPPAQLPLLDEQPVRTLGLVWVEVLESRIGPVGLVIDARQLLAGEPPPDPGAVYVGQMPQQPEEGKVGRRNGAHRQLLPRQASTLVEEGVPAP